MKKTGQITVERKGKVNYYASVEEQSEQEFEPLTSLPPSDTIFEAGK